MKTLLICPILLFVLTTHADINKLTGQPQFSINLGPYASINYKGGVSGDVSRPNEQSPAGIVGLGFRFGTPYITVDHKYTVDISDDSWYLNDGYGNSEEIIRVWEGTGAEAKERFYLQQSPERKIKVYDNNPGTWQPRIIEGWEIYGIDGTISRYGYVTGESDAGDALRRLPSKICIHVLNRPVHLEVF